MSASDMLGATPLGFAPKTPVEFADAVKQLIDRQRDWQAQVLNLSPAEGLMSRTAIEALSTDLASRLSEGPPTAKDPTMPGPMHMWARSLEGWVAELAGRLFNAGFVDCRPVSNTMANAMALAAMTSPGDVIAVQSLQAGGNMSYQDRGVSALLGLEVVPLPGMDDFRVDLEAAAELIGRVRPRVVVVGGSKILYPYGIDQLAQMCEEAGSYLMYDAAHVAPFVAGDRFEDPLRAGATVMTLGTHKLMGGPVGGLIISNDATVAERVRTVVETRFLQTRDLNKYASAVVSLAEMLEHRQAYAKAMQANIARLSDNLSSDLAVIGRLGSSQTHMMLADLGTGATDVFHALARSSIFVSNTATFYDQVGRRSALRLSVAQVTRRGMGPAHMDQLSELILRAIHGDDVLRDVNDLMAQFNRVIYSFDSLES